MGQKPAWARHDAVDSVRQRLAAAGITRVTDFHTSEFKYSKELHTHISQMLIKTLKEQSLWL